MSTIFNFNNDEIDANDDISIDIDDLYEKNKQQELKKLEIYNKMLLKIHNKIKIQSRINKNDQWCWYQIPTMMIGVPEYNFLVCINFIIDKLKTNGFSVNFYKPNLLLISWKDWVPEYVRKEIYNKLGKNIDSYGNLINSEKDDNDDNNSSTENSNKKQVTFKSIKDVSELTSKVYNTKFIEKLDKINK